MLHFHLSTTPICSKIHFIIEGLPQFSRILFRCKQRGFSFGFNGKTPKESKIREIREIRAGKLNIPHSALKDSITNLSKLAL